ncbi:MAG: leucine--tRNA ligase [Patescibacteria group bacterium]|nr:leucine--tRNA ligase [Patescibacteria group bacterium]
MSDYNHEKIEKKWQVNWQKNQLYTVKNGENKPKFYCLDMFPYPSGTGLHVGHPKGYIATDVVSRLKMMQGYNVLHPMGWDAFGLPAENYALKTGIQPAISTARNIVTYKRQLEVLGFTYDWNREINTTDPAYYKWTQWAFIQMFKRGLVYESNEPINWCPTCKTGLANEDLENGLCERCGTPVEKKPLRQWVIKMTDYAERLLADLDKLPDWEDSIKDMQRNWLGKSEGALVKFIVLNNNKQTEVQVFTTRPDTLFGATYLVLAPEHNLVSEYLPLLENKKEVEAYIEKIKNKSDLERTDLNKDKTGVELKGIKALNPATNEELPIFIADYVLAGYGTGAIMAVPAHDERDWEFAKKFDLPIKCVVLPKDDSVVEKCFSDYGQAVNSGFLDGLSTAEAKAEMIKWLEKYNLGERKINWRLKDWVFSRQRYWGEPIPLVHCEKCGVVPVAEKDLPLRLPEVDKYEPSGTGESPLATIHDWVNTKCPKCGGQAKRETNTMPQWAGSSWYWLRYMDVDNNEALVDKKIEKYWSPVDLYVGGAEHATRHLIYARFWHKFLFDIGVVSEVEPFKKLRHVGLVLAEDGRKMSKRWNNVVNPDDVAHDFGADALRIYEMFMGPFDQAVAWNTNGLVGARKFLNKIWNLFDKLQENYETNRESVALLHKTIKKVTADIDDFKFNTAISALMILVNKLTEEEKIAVNDFAILLQLIAPFAPHFAEEMWEKIGYESSIFLSAWPEVDDELARDENIKIAIQINGKLRDEMEVNIDLPNNLVEELACDRDKIRVWLAGKEIVKVIVVPNRIINIVIK